MQLVEKVYRVELNLGSVGDEESQSGESGGADCKALAHCGGGVADCVKLVGNLADAGVKTAHLGDTAGVIGDGAVCVNGDGDAGGGKHTDGCKSDTVEVIGDLVGNEDADGDKDDGNPCAHHADRNTGDDGGGGAGLGLGCDALDGIVIIGGVDLGDKADHQTYDKTGNDGQRIVNLVEEYIAQDDGQNRNDGCGDIGAGLERLVRVGVILPADKEGRDDGGEDTDCGDDEGEDGTGTGEQSLNGNAESQSGDESADV